jgi:hypothetical protein
LSVNRNFELSPRQIVCSEEEHSRFVEYEAELRAMVDQPYFSRVNRNVSVRLGETAYLPCRAKLLKDSYMVTWMRVTDVSVLTVGALAFSSDRRFSVIHVPRPRIHADDWTLVITSSQSKDTGQYECSVNTLPKISHTVNLDVIELQMQDSPYSVPSKSLLRPETVEMSPGPVASISGPQIQYVSAGSTVGLECRISGLASPPLSLYWQRGSRVLTAKERPGISLESEKVPGISTARLFLSHVSPRDTANYSCISDLAAPASVLLVVTKDHMGSALVSLSSCPSLPSPSSLLATSSLLTALLTTAVFPS